MNVITKILMENISCRALEIYEMKVSVGGSNWRKPIVFKFEQIYLLSYSATCDLYSIFLFYPKVINLLTGQIKAKKFWNKKRIVWTCIITVIIALVIGICATWVALYGNPFSGIIC